MIDLSGITESDLLRKLPPGFGSVIPRSALTREPTLWVEASREFQLFADSECAAYAEVRLKWEALKQTCTDAALQALTLAMSARLGVSSAVLAPLVSCMLVQAARDELAMRLRTHGHITVTRRRSTRGR